MKEGYRLLGEYIRQVDVRNREGKEDNLLGVSVQKQFIPSIANFSCVLNFDSFINFFKFFPTLSDNFILHIPINKISIS